MDRGWDQNVGNLLVVPVHQHLSRGGQNVGGTLLGCMSVFRCMVKATSRSLPLLSANVARNLSVFENSGSPCVRSVKGLPPLQKRCDVSLAVRFKDRTEWLTDSDRIVDILDFDNVAGYPALLTLGDRTAVLGFTEYGARRVNDREAALQLGRLQVFVMLMLCGNRARLAKEKDTKTTCQRETGADLG